MGNLIPALFVDIARLAQVGRGGARSARLWSDRTRSFAQEIPYVKVYAYGAIAASAALLMVRGPPSRLPARLLPC